MFTIIIFILSLCNLQSSGIYYPDEYKNRRPLNLDRASYLLAQENEGVWSQRHNIFLRQIYNNPEKCAIRFSSGSPVRLRGGYRILHDMFVTLYSGELHSKAASTIQRCWRSYKTREETRLALAANQQRLCLFVTGSIVVTGIGIVLAYLL